METTKQAGTTLAILAPYLDHGIQVQHTEWGARKTLTGLTKDDYAEGTAHVAGSPPTRLGYLLPVLRSFEDLVVPLPDGTVPAVEVARIQWPTRTAVRAVMYKPGEIHLWERASPSSEEMRFIYLYESDLVQTNTFSWRAYDYLRSQHFAVGLEPHQYVRLTSTPSG